LDGQGFLFIYNGLSLFLAYKSYLHEYPKSVTNIYCVYCTLNASLFIEVYYTHFGPIPFPYLCIVLCHSLLGQSPFPSRVVYPLFTHKTFVQ